MPDIFSLSANELTSKLREGEISSVEVCSHYIERIGKFEKDVKAWSHFNKKLLLEKAAEADEHRISGKPLGLLHGLPVAVKDIIGTLDMPTECGTTIRKKMTASQDSEVVNLLKVAGAIIMGKTETTELAYFHQEKLLILMTTKGLPEVPQVDLQQQWQLIWHLSLLVRKLMAQLLDQHLTAVLLGTNHHMA
jgi:Asp-tRNA(Asn)/Glu-tRNA(Gln) amidotransferase A subunit family amidase